MVYIRRIQVFSGTCYVPALFYAMSTIVCLAAIFISVATFQAKTTSGFIRQWMWSYTATLSGIVVSDGLIAATLCYYLKKSELSLARWYLYFCPRFSIMLTLMLSPCRSSKLIKKLMLWTIGELDIDIFVVQSILLIFMLKKQACWPGTVLLSSFGESLERWLPPSLTALAQLICVRDALVPRIIILILLQFLTMQSSC